MSWVVAAFASAFFAGITSILAKCGIKQTDSDVATAIRTCVVLVFAVGNGGYFWIHWNHWQHRTQILALSRPLGTRYRRFVDLLL